MTYTRAAGRLSPEEVPAYVRGEKKLSHAHRCQPDLRQLLQQAVQARRDPAVMTDEKHLARIGPERVRAWLDRFTALVVIPVGDGAQSPTRQTNGAGS
jgi:hypothetical protein